MEFSQFDRHPAYASSDRRSAADRRSGGLRREADRAERFREMVAFAIAMCGGLAVLFLFFVVVGTIEVGNAIGATIAALVLAAVWLFGFWRRLRSDASMVQRPDRERRGF